MNLMSKIEIGDSNRNKNLLLVFIIGLGFLIRVYKLGIHDLWHDEAVSYMLIKFFSLNQKLYMLTSPHPPLYQVFLAAWMYLVGETEYALRLMSVIFGLISIALTYKLGNLYGGKKTGVAGAFLMAVSPMHIWYSQEARAYVMLSTLILASMCAFLELLIKNKSPHFKYFTIFSILSVYTHYFSLIVLLSGIIILIFKMPRSLLRGWFYSYAIIFISFLPILPIFLSQLKDRGTFFWIPVPTPYSIFTTFANITLGYNMDKFSGIIMVCLCLYLCILGLVRLKAERMVTSIFWTLILLPIASVFFVSKLYAPVYIDKYLLSIAPLYYILIAGGLITIKNIIVRRAIFSFMCIIIFFAIRNYFSGYLPADNYVAANRKEPVEPAVHYVNENLKEGDVIAHTNNCASPQFFYYFVKNKMDINKIRKISRIVYIPDHLRTWYREKLSTGQGLPLLSPLDLSRKDLNLSIFKRIWIISSAMNRSAELWPNSIAVRKFMHEKCKLIDSKNINGIYIDLYASCYN